MMKHFYQLKGDMRQILFLFYFFITNTYAAMTQHEALRVIDNVEHTMSPLVMKKTSMELKILFDWNAELVPLNEDNSGGAITYTSSKQVGPKIKGGVARHSSIEEIGFALILCHEIGHFVGNKKGIAYTNVGIKASEAAADKFAIKVCLPELGYNKFDISEGSFQTGQFLFDLFNGKRPGFYRRPNPSKRTSDYRNDFETSGALQCRLEQMLFWSGNQNKIADNCLRHD